MKHPCELIVYNVLPVVRGELSKELVNVHGFSQARVARLFKVSGAAVSQYLKGLRGIDTLVYENSHYTEFRELLSQSAERLASGKTGIADELCFMCDVSKKIGMIEEMCMKEESGELVKCLECPMDGFEYCSNNQCKKS